MSNTAIHHYSVLSDSLERQLVRSAGTAERGRQVVDFGFDVVRLSKRVFSAFVSYMAELSRSLDEARMRDARFSKSHW